MPYTTCALTVYNFLESYRISFLGGTDRPELSLFLEYDPSLGNSFQTIQDKMVWKRQESITY